MAQTQCIGVVGGVGPYAGLDLVRKLFDHTRADCDQGHLPVMLLSFPDRIADRPAFLLRGAAVNPGEAIGEIMAELALAGATVIGLPCNTAHSPRILDAALARLAATGRPVRFVHMIKAVTDRARTFGEGARIGILGTEATLETRLYQDSLEEAGLVPLTPDAAGRRRVQEAISNREYGIKAQSPVSERARADLLAEAYNLVEAGARAIILGCTEIPLALPEKTLGGAALIDATDVLAVELVRAFAPDRLKD